MLNIDTIREDAKLPASLLRFKLYRRYPERVCRIKFPLLEQDCNIKNILLKEPKKEWSPAIPNELKEFISICCGYVKFESLEGDRYVYLDYISKEVVEGKFVTDDFNWRVLDHAGFFTDNKKPADFCFVWSNGAVIETAGQILDFDKIKSEKEFFETTDLISSSVATEVEPDSINLMSGYLFYRNRVYRSPKPQRQNFARLTFSETKK